MQFNVGQRWASHTEPKLGLGLVAEIDDRQIVLSYPAASETRAYSKASPPLSRIHYRVGDRLKNSEEEAFTVIQVEEQNSLYFYLGVKDDGTEIAVPEWHLNSQVSFSTPIEKLVSGQVDHNKEFELRVETLLKTDYIQKLNLTGLLGSRTELIPHQLYIAHEVSNRYAPRVLLSDEVGLGKTIEAGMIVHHQLMSGLANRVLIIVPDNLVHQWFVEMLRRFNIHFAIFDETRVTSLQGESEQNPFDSEQFIITTLSLFTENPNIFELAIAVEWDLGVIDEAHHIHWSQSSVSVEYQIAEQVATHCKGLLLLTATPEQVGLESHFARLKLLDPDRYSGFEQFLDEYEGYTELNHLLKALLNHTAQNEVGDVGGTIEPDLLNQLKSYLGSEWQEALLEDRDRLIKMLLDRYGTGRSVFRNRREVLGGFPERAVHFYPLNLPEAYQTLSAQQLQFPEQAESIEEWIEIDPRVSWIKDKIQALKPSKILVICHHSETAQALDKYFNLYAGIRSTAFYEGLSLVERDRAAAYFAEEEFGARVLVCSEIGSEGRNFQFAHHIVLFDLPKNPDLIEQRIGRLDRIGQKETIQIHTPFFKESPQEVMQAWFHEGLNLFTESCSAGFSIFERFQNRIEALCEKYCSEGLVQLITETKAYTQEIKATLREAQNDLLAYQSCNRGVANDLIKQIEAEADAGVLPRYLGQLFDQYGLDYEEHSEATYILRPTDHMKIDHFPGISDEAMTVTFDRNKALQREDYAFLTWEHPLVRGAMDLVISSELGNTTVASMKIKGLPPGTLLMETWFTVETIADKRLQLDRFLPVMPYRFLIDLQGRSLSSIMPHDKLNQLCKPVKRRIAQVILQQARDQVDSMLERSEQMASEYLPEPVDMAKARMLATLGGEIERLQALKQVNPAVRECELTFLEGQRQASMEAIEKADAVLQAVRLIVISDE